MHEQMARLYEAAEKMKGVTGQSELARLMNKSPQQLMNWEARGISSEGLIDSQMIIGCSAVWLRNGVGPMVLGEPFTLEANGVGTGLSDALKLTTETAHELLLLTVYRLSNEDNRKVIDIAVEVARRDLSWGGINERQ